MTTEKRIAFSIEEFCLLAGIGRSLAYKEIQSGRLPTRKVGRRTLITASCAHEWLERLPDGGANAAKVAR